MNIYEDDNFILDDSDLTNVLNEDELAKLEQALLDAIDNMPVDDDNDDVDPRWYLMDLFD